MPKKKPSSSPGPHLAVLYVPFIKRNRYFHGKLLSAQDLADEQDYHREMRRLHNRYLHGWGIVSGLELTVKEGEVEVSPGMAIDLYGREIVIPRRLAIPLPKQGRSWYATVHYVERETDPAPSGGDGTQASRIEEGAEIALSAQYPRDHEEEPSCEAHALGIHAVCIGRIESRRNGWRAVRGASAQRRRAGRLQR